MVWLVEEIHKILSGCAAAAYDCQTVTATV